MVNLTQDEQLFAPGWLKEELITSQRVVYPFPPAISLTIDHVRDACVDSIQGNGQGDKHGLMDKKDQGV